MRLSGALFLCALIAALAWASREAFRPIAAASAAPAIAAIDPAAQLARARSARRAEAVVDAVTTVLEEQGVTRGDVRSEATAAAGEAGFPRTELAVDVPGAAAPVADALAGKVGVLDGAAVARERRPGGVQHLSMRLDGEEVMSIDLYAAPLPEPPPELEGRPRVAIVIDDLGYNAGAVEKLLALSHNLTYSVLPNAPSSREVADAVHAKGAEVILHLPMEPVGDKKISHEGMLLHDMPPAILRQKTDDALLAVPGADGVNNHMGSLLTADEKAMNVVMSELAGKNLFFLDSRTTPQTVAFRAARAAGLPALERDVFLDDVAEIGPILKQLSELEARAKKRGFAVAIGHPYPATIAALEQGIPQLIDDGIEIVPARDLAARPAALTEDTASGNP